ncbi:MAG: hypothetical protein A3G34_16710 [Candidatus Lindowbacteria bacterium RIFCSPLOWO2_12_FULL_62_27]|nr:MAG: hypothetical protein A3G34_16710 [Candidatus Lindowbacteria bacterium RIFCSPLOWO2_12_FULL_62_27]OGH63663.1 MAG: hypothetical protein A3I06_05535 [Candidatus Lindowbacteria bacterium RIFCSPLOWO2_02_FULL_62_12]
MQNQNSLQPLAACLNWFAAAELASYAPEVSESRDVFQGRLERVVADPGVARMDTQSLSLILAVTGEIGNNCFDHNLGQWRDQPGCWFGLSSTAESVVIWVADRGQGFCSTLRRVLPDIGSDQNAIEIAYEQVISGRYPERRGNGLKFVRNVINGNPDKGLYCCSGSGRLGFGGACGELETLAAGSGLSAGLGVFTVLQWRFP